MKSRIPGHAVVAMYESHTGADKLKAEGKVDELKGTAKGALEDIKHAAKGAAK